MIQLPEIHPIQLEFHQFGLLRRPLEGVSHKKTVPCTIIAQPLVGAYDVECANQRVRVDSGSMLMIPAFTPVTLTHHNGPDGYMAARWCHLHLTFLGVADLLSLFDPPLLLPTEVTRELEPWFEKNKTSDGNGFAATVSRDIHQHYIAFGIAQTICKHFSLKTDRFPGMGKRLGPALRYIRENLASSLTVEQLAARVNLSPSQFYAVFKKAYCLTPMRYVRKVRLEVAGRMLLTGDSTLAEVADAVGFADAFHLSHAFKAHFGHSPTQYRAQSSMHHS